MNTKRILVINDYKTGGGAEVVLGQLIKGLEDNGFKVRLFYGKELNQSKKGNPLSYIYSGYYKRELAGMLQEFKPDRVHFLNYYHILTPSVLDAVKVYKKSNPLLKVIYTAHDFHLLCPNSGLTSFQFPGGRIIREEPFALVSEGGGGLWLKRWDHRGSSYSLLKVLQWWTSYRVKKSHEVIDEIICPGNFMFSLMKGAFPEKKIHLVRNPYVCNSVVSKIEKSKDKKVDRNCVNFVFTGRVAQEKGLVQFVTNLKMDIWENINLHIYGTGPDLERLKTLVTKKHIDKKCFFYGYRSHDDILSLLPDYDVMLLPSVSYENAPLGIVEAAFAGLRVAASNWGGIKSMAEFCGGEYLFDPENPEDLNRVVERIIHDVVNNSPVERDYDQLKHAFSYESFIKKHAGIYR